MSSFALYLSLLLLPMALYSLQANSSLVMVRPLSFGRNPETAGSNAFQREESSSLPEEIAERAKEEFDGLFAALKRHEIEVHAIEESEYSSPDSIFPNNWFSIDPHTGRLFLYPMMAENRRRERAPAIVDLLCSRFGVKEVVDLTEWEGKRRFLEGTGSVVFDYVEKKGYACLSPRTDGELLRRLSLLLGYRPVAFLARDRKGQEIYHTNVMMAIGSEVAILCGESIDPFDRERVESELTASGKAIVDISFEQMENFCGNVLEVANERGERYLVMSTRAYNAFSEEQLAAITRYVNIIHTPIDTIETIGGGGVRCMLAGAWRALR